MTIKNYVNRRQPAKIDFLACRICILSAMDMVRGSMDTLYDYTGYFYKYGCYSLCLSMSVIHSFCCIKELQAGSSANLVPIIKNKYCNLSVKPSGAPRLGLVLCTAWVIVSALTITNERQHRKRNKLLFPSGH